MKVAVTTSGNDLEGLFDSRFGRAPKFLIYNLSDLNFSVIDNSENTNAAQGAGINSATVICKHGVEAVITGHCGPKAYKALNSAGIKVYNTKAKLVSEALEKFKSGQLTEAESADVRGYWE